MISDTIKTMEKNRKDKKQLLANFHRLYSNFKSLSTDEFELEMAISLCVDHGQYSYRYLKLEISDSCNKCWARAYWDSPQSLTIFPRDCQSYNRDQESWSNFLDLVVEFLISEWGIEEIILNPKI